MPYQHTSWLDLRNELARRLDDFQRIFWVDEELGIYLTEALRTFGLATGFWRERGTFSFTEGASFFNLEYALPDLLGFSVTDFDIIKELQYHLLETAATAAQYAWLGTDMFTLADLTKAIERRRNQFLSETGLVLHVTNFPVASPPVGRQLLADNIIDVRRVIWQGAGPIGYYKDLRREDEYALTAFNQFWSFDADRPMAWSVLGPPPLELQLAKPPMDIGSLWLTTVSAGDALDPINGATILGIPDDLTPAIKWGALADLLGRDGVSRDAERSSWAAQRYEQYVELARLLPVVLHTELNGQPVLPVTMAELDSFDPSWQNKSGPPTDVVIEGANLVWVYPPPDGEIYSMTMDVVRRTPVPTADADLIQLGREQLDAVLDYAVHLALFKVAGVEWRATQPQADNFLAQCVMFNRRLAASARYIFTPKLASERNESVNTRWGAMEGVGVMTSGPQQRQSQGGAGA
jgi:hypothetical protein